MCARDVNVPEDPLRDHGTAAPRPRTAGRRIETAARGVLDARGRGFVAIGAIAFDRRLRRPGAQKIRQCE
jgi:hypothetical protein